MGQVQSVFKNHNVEIRKKNFNIRLAAAINTAERKKSVKKTI